MKLNILEGESSGKYDKKVNAHVNCQIKRTSSKTSNCRFDIKYVIFIHYSDNEK